MKKYKILALIGESGAGKDYLMKQVLWRYPQYHEIISCTTRPIRENEKNGINYYYLTEEEFAAADLLEATSFNGWRYGTSTSALDPSSANIGVFNPDGIRNLLKRDDVDVKIFRVWVNDKERLIRQLTRESNPNVTEIIRRYNTDQQDFLNLEFEHKILPNRNWADVIDALGYLDPSALWAESDNC